MNAKQKMAKLFVRIPLDLKQSLKSSAYGKGISVAAEVTCLLHEQFNSSRDRKREVNQGYDLNKHVKNIEDMVLYFVAKSDGETAFHNLQSLEEHVLNIRRLREQSAQDVQRKIEENQAFLSQPAQPVADIYATIMPPSVIRKRPPELTDPEQRRLNLIEILKPRGAKTQLAIKLGCTRAWITHLLSEPGSAKHRTISPEVAEKIKHALGIKSNSLNQRDPNHDVVALQKAGLELVEVGNKLRRKR